MADDVMWQMYRGERIPDIKEQWSLAKNYKRTFIRDWNKIHRRDFEYESDEDMGEDLNQGRGDSDQE